MKWENIHTYKAFIMFLLLSLSIDRDTHILVISELFKQNQQHTSPEICPILADNAWMIWDFLKLYVKVRYIYKSYDSYDKAVTLNNHEKSKK